MDSSLRLKANIEQVASRGDACVPTVPDSQLHADSADADANAVQLVNIEQVFIKGEPLEETSNHTACYDNILDSVSKEEYTNDNININDNPIAKGYNNPSTTSITHNIRGTRKNNTNNFYCFLCKKVFTRKSNLKIHMKIHDGKKEFDCDVCNKSFRLKQHLEGHMTCHTGKKDFQCNVCKKLFKRKDHLKGHMKKHSGIKQFHCPICRKSFIQNDTLKLHMKIHSGIKYQCSVCPKQFTYNFNLKNHMKIHNGIKNYKCSECNKEFTQNAHLKTHMITHSGKKEFQCSICKKLFSRNENLKQHMRTHRCAVCDKTSKQSCDHKGHKEIRNNIACADLSQEK